MSGYMFCVPLLWPLCIGTVSTSSEWLFPSMLWLRPNHPSTSECAVMCPYDCNHFPFKNLRRIFFFWNWRLASAIGINKLNARQTTHIIITGHDRPCTINCCCGRCVRASRPLAPMPLIQVYISLHNAVYLVDICIVAEQSNECALSILVWFVWSASSSHDCLLYRNFSACLIHPGLPLSTLPLCSATIAQFNSNDLFIPVEIFVAHTHTHHIDIYLQ